MNDDITVLHEHLPDFPEYADEVARNGSDMRVRAFVGKSLARLDESRGAGFDEASRTRFDQLLFQSQFSNNQYVKRLGHGHLDEAMIAALAHHDRALLDVALRLPAASADDVPGVLRELSEQYEARYQPLEA